MKLDVPAWLLPLSKLSRINLFLDQLLFVRKNDTNPDISREAMESGTGLLLWVAEYRRELRPWLAGFFHAISAPSQTLLSISHAAWSEAVSALDENLVLMNACTFGPI